MILTILTFLLVVFSFALVVGVPVILATPGNWELYQGRVFNLASLWSALVLLIGFISIPTK